MSAKNLPIREHARSRLPLSGPDAQALEGALQQAERDIAARETDLRAMAAALAPLVDATAVGDLARLRVTGPVRAAVERWRERG